MQKLIILIILCFVSLSYCSPIGENALVKTDWKFRRSIFSRTSQVEGRQTYSYYWLGRIIWQTPLWFMPFFVLYICALIAKSIGKHQVNFPSIIKTHVHPFTHIPKTPQTDIKWKL